MSDDDRGRRDDAPPARGPQPPDDGAPEPETPDETRWTDQGGAVIPDTPPAAPAAAGAEFRDKWLRAEAELQNFRRRAQRDWEEGRRNAEEAVLVELLGAVDDLERAVESARAAGADAAWTRGVELVLQRLRDYLARQGVQVEDPIGRPFDPAFHEALLEVDAPEGLAPGAVVQVVHKGYRRGERALRAARVVVARHPAGSHA